MPHKLVIAFLILTSLCCQHNTTTRAEATQVDITQIKDSIFLVRGKYLTDSIPKGYKSLIFNVLKKYDRPNQVPMEFEPRHQVYIKSTFEGFKNLGDLNGDDRPDSVFFLDPFHYGDIDSGQSYYFTDTSLPRIPSDSYCCHINNVFVLPDIAENKTRELGIYYSSCASRYKSIRYYILKNGGWDQFATSEFDILTQDPSQINFSDLVKKLDQNTIAVKNFLELKTFWDTIRLSSK